MDRGQCAQLGTAEGSAVLGQCVQAVAHGLQHAGSPLHLQVERVRQPGGAAAQGVAALPTARCSGEVRRSAGRVLGRELASGQQRGQDPVLGVVVGERVREGDGGPTRSAAELDPGPEGDEIGTPAPPVPLLAGEQSTGSGCIGQRELRVALAESGARPHHQQLGPGPRPGAGPFGRRLDHVDRLVGEARHEEDPSLVEGQVELRVPSGRVLVGEVRERVECGRHVAAEELDQREVVAHVEQVQVLPAPGEEGVGGKQVTLGGVELGEQDLDVRSQVEGARLPDLVARGVEVGHGLLQIGDGTGMAAEGGEHVRASHQHLGADGSAGGGVADCLVELAQGCG